MKWRFLNSCRSRRRLLRHIMLRLVRSYGLRQGHPQWIGCNIRCGVCVFLANSQRIEGHWTGRAQGSADWERSLAQILDRRRFTVRRILRGQSWQCCVKSVVFLDSDAYRFGARVFDCCDVRISLLHNYETSVTPASVLPIPDRVIDAIRPISLKCKAMMSEMGIFQQLTRYISSHEGAS